MVKLVLPGICGIDTIRYNHTQVKQEAAISFGKFEERPTRLDMEEVACMLGIDFIVSMVTSTPLSSFLQSAG